jgi:hypothetical protein
MDMIENRAFLIVSAKRPVAGWMAELEGNTDADETVLNHRTVYLVAALDNPSPEQQEKLVKRKFSAIFENELFSWVADRSHWPTDRSWERFCEWFEWQYVDEGFDAEPGRIEKIEEQY